MRCLVAGLDHLRCVRLQRIKERRRVDGRVYDGPPRRVGWRLDIWVEEAQRCGRLLREDG